MWKSWNNKKYKTKINKPVKNELSLFYNIGKCHFCTATPVDWKNKQKCNKCLLYWKILKMKSYKSDCFLFKLINHTCINYRDRYVYLFWSLCHVIFVSVMSPFNIDVW